MAKLNFGGVEETVVTREEFTLDKAREVLAGETIAVLGYGVQGPGQSLNLRDNGFNVIVGQRPGKTYDKAVADGWIPGETLFSIEEAAQRGTIVMCLLSDAAVLSVWPTIKANLKAGDALYFSHGFAITWPERTGVVPPADVDVIMVAPKGSARQCAVFSLKDAASMHPMPSNRITPAVRSNAQSHSELALDRGIFSRQLSNARQPAISQANVVH